MKHRVVYHIEAVEMDDTIHLATREHIGVVKDGDFSVTIDAKSKPLYCFKKFGDLHVIFYQTGPYKAQSIADGKIIFSGDSDEFDPYTVVEFGGKVYFATHGSKVREFDPQTLTEKTIFENAVNFTFHPVLKSPIMLSNKGVVHHNWVEANLSKVVPGIEAWNSIFATRDKIVVAATGQAEGRDSLKPNYFFLLRLADLRLVKADQILKIPHSPSHSKYWVHS